MKPFFVDDAAMPLRNDTPTAAIGTSGRAPRIDWVDYAKGICIVMVVMMHSVLGVEAAAGEAGFMHALVAFAKPFRMPDFFLISGLFLSVVIDRDWRVLRAVRLFPFRLSFCRACIRAVGSRAETFRRGAGGIAPVGCRQRRPGGLRHQRTTAGLAGAGACWRLRDRRDGHAAGAGALARLAALLRRALHRHLSRLLPADGGDTNAALEVCADPRHRRHLTACHHSRRARRARDLVVGARRQSELPVRTAERLLDRSKKERARAAGGGVTSDHLQAPPAEASHDR